jgi:hypothetical protein
MEDEKDGMINMESGQKNISALYIQPSWICKWPYGIS